MPVNTENLFSALDPQVITSKWTDPLSNTQPMIGSALFPAAHKTGLDLSWIKGKNDIPISLMPSAFDAKAKFRDRIGVTKIDSTMPFFREGYHLKEKDRQELLRAQDSNNPYFVDALVNHIYQDTNNLLSGALVVSERMIWQLLAPLDGTPKIAIDENGEKYDYGYDPDGSFHANNFIELTTATDKWNDATNCDPIDDLRQIMDKIEESTGVRPTRAIMSRKTFNYLVASAKVRQALLAQNTTANVYMTEPIVKSIFSQILGLNIGIYTKVYKDGSGNSHSFYPDDMVTLLPEGTLGTTWYGTTPEEADQMALADVGASTAIFNTGIAVTRVIEAHPVNVSIIASEIVLPSFEQMDKVGVLKVV